MTEPQDRTATFNYLVPEKKSTLYRNGQISLRRNPDGSDSGIQGLDLVAEPKTVLDGRAVPERPTIDRCGFELLEAPLAHEGFDFFDADELVTRHYKEVEELVTASVGARYALAFDHNLRWAQGKAEKRRLDKGQEVQAPIQLVHGDYTLTSAPGRLRQLSQPPTTNDTLRDILEPGASALDLDEAETAIRGECRYAIINVWRNIAPEPVQSHPLGVCDARSVHPEDLAVFEIHYTDRVGENYFVKSADTHQWHYFPLMRRHEPLLIKQWDSEGTFARTQGLNADGTHTHGTSTFSIHSAFEDPLTAEDAPDRQSLEVRCVVMF